MKLNRSYPFFIFFGLLFLNACTNSAVSNSPTVLPISSTETITFTPIPPTATTSFSTTIEPTSTEWLPYNPNLSDTGCGEFTATVPIKDAKELPKEKIIKDLFEMYLEHFKSPNLGGRCRLEEFKIENIKMDQIVAFTAKNQWVETTAWVDYSIKIKEVPSNWIAANGELAPDGWIIHKSLIIGFLESDEHYVLILVGGP